MTLHDREAYVGPCLASLQRAGADFTLCIVANGCDFDPTPYLTGDYNVEVFAPLGPAMARNASLGFRDPGQDWVTLDSDIVVESDNWLATLLTTLHQADRGAVCSALLHGDMAFGGVWPNTGLYERPHTAGLRVYRGDVVDQIGAQRPYGMYGCEDLDYDERIRGAGYRIVWDSSVVAVHPPVEADDAKQALLNDCLPCLKAREQSYREGRDLFLALDDASTLSAS